MSNLSVYGAPGTGKTHFLVNEYLRLSKDNQVFMTTFRKDTALGIRGKLAEITGRETETFKNEVNTIHGLCYSLIGGRGFAEVIKSEDIKKFNTKTGYNLKVGESVPTYDSKDSLTDCWGWMRNTGTPFSMIVEYPGWRNLNLSPSKAVEIIKAYEDYKQEIGKIDFTDMLTMANDAGLAPCGDYLMVDEFQDLTKLQHDIFMKWAGEIENVTIAGDPLQSIYGFWGGNPGFFNQFDADKIVLPKSYRLPAVVWKQAQAITLLNGMKTPDINPGNHDGMVKNITSKEYVNRVDLWNGSGQFTVYHLVRSNFQAPAITHKLADAGILWQGLNGWTESEIDLYNAIIKARNNEVFFKSELKGLVEHYPTELFNIGGTKRAILEAIDNMTSHWLIQNNHMSDELIKILKSADPVEHMVRPGIMKAKKINNALRVHGIRIRPSDFKTAVMTIHASKGLEANRVFLHTGVTNNIKKGMRADRAAEARVFYVGITRAINELYIVKDAGENFKIQAVAA